MTQVQIANLALSKLGHTEKISDLAEDSVEAREINGAWEYVRKNLLSYHGWSFAKKRKVLATHGTPPDAWAYRYAFPSDCVLPLMIDDSVRSRLADERIEWERSVDDSSGSDVDTIDTDQSPATLIYVRDHTTVESWPPHFVRAFVHELAKEIAMAITTEPTFVDRLEQRAMLELSKALSIDLQSGGTIIEEESEFVQARY